MGRLHSLQCAGQLCTPALWGQSSSRPALRDGASRSAAKRGGERMKRTLLVLTALIAVCLATAQASRVVTDETGRTVTVPDHPHRVVCLVPSVTDTVFALGSGDDVVAVSDYTTFPPAALKKPSIGSLVNPSNETILSFHPDLVVGTSIPGATETAAKLSTVGVPVYLVDPHGLAGILHSVDSVGEALNRVPEAAALNASLSRRIAAVK